MTGRGGGHRGRRRRVRRDVRGAGRGRRVVRGGDRGREQVRREERHAGRDAIVVPDAGRAAVVREPQRKLPDGTRVHVCMYVLCIRCVFDRVCEKKNGCMCYAFVVYLIECVKKKRVCIQGTP